jgi:hypothetical protein
VVLMKQTKAGNPDIRLYVLAWGASGWLGGGNFWSGETVRVPARARTR